MKSPLLVTGMLLVGCGRSSVAPGPPPIAAVQDADEAPAPPPSSSATVVAEDRCARVFSPATGRVVRVVAMVGQTVKKGDPLLTIEPPGADDAWTSEVGKAQANLIAAKRDLQRQKELNELDPGPAADLEAAEDAYRRAKADLERARARAVMRRPLLYTRNVSPGDQVDEAIDGAIAPRALFVIRPPAETCNPDP